MANEQTQTAQASTPAAKVESTAAAAPAIQKSEADTPPVKIETLKQPETVLSSEAKVEPIKFDLKLPKDSQLDPAYVDKIEAEAKAEGLSNEQAQARLERDNQLRTEVLNQQQMSMKAQSEKWVEELKADKDFGGEQFKENVSMAKRALDRFADPAFRKILDDTGLGNNPHLVRAFARIGKQMAPDKLVIGSTGSTGKPSRESKLYPTMKPQE